MKRQGDSEDDLIESIEADISLPSNDDEFSSFSIKSDNDESFEDIMTMNSITSQSEVINDNDEEHEDHVIEQDVLDHDCLVIEQDAIVEAIDDDLTEDELDTRNVPIVCYETWDIEMFSAIKASQLLYDTRNVIDSIDISYIRIDPHSIRVHYSTKLGDPKGRVYGSIAKKTFKNSHSQHNRSVTNEMVISSPSSSFHTEDWRLCGASLCQLPRWIRRLIAHQYYEDYDIVNCAPTLIYQIMKKNGFSDHELINLTTYIKTRKEMFAKYVKMGYNEGSVKTTFLSILHLGKPKKKYPESITLSTEVNTIYRKLSQMTDEYRELYKKSNTRKGNQLGSFASHVWQREEFKVMSVMRYYFHSLGYPIDRMVLCWDGIMVEKNDRLRELIDFNNLSQLIMEKTGYQVSIVQKSLLPTHLDYDFLINGQQKED